MLVVTGLRTTIVAEIIRLTGERVLRIAPKPEHGMPLHIPPASHYLLAAGLLTGRHLLEQTAEEMQTACWVNLLMPMRICEQVLLQNPTARLCIVGSESARHGSFDQVYAATKAGVHAYVHTRKVNPPQQLFAVSPGIISDSGMTRRRVDYPDVLSTRKTVTAEQVARVIIRHLYDSSAEPLNNAIAMVGP